MDSGRAELHMGLLGLCILPRSFRLKYGWIAGLSLWFCCILVF